jgi:hypothetical protein
MFEKKMRKELKKKNNIKIFKVPKFDKRVENNINPPTVGCLHFLMGQRSSQKVSVSLFNNLAIELPSLRISPPLNRAWLVAMGILSIVFFHTAF